MCDIDKVKVKGSRFGKCDLQQKYIAVMWKNRKLWLCQKCWNRLADSNWGQEK